MEDDLNNNPITGDDSAQGEQVVESEVAETQNVAQDQPTAEPQQEQTPAPEPVQESVPGTNQSFIKNLLARAGEKIQFNKNKKLEKILELAKQKGKISNKDVCESLRVSPASATNYFNALEKQGRLKQVGSTGHSVFYELNG